jgi:putative transposase
VERLSMMDQDHPHQSLRRQCELLSLNRSSLYYEPRPESDMNDQLMKRLDELYTAWPFLGYRKLTQIFNNEGWRVNRKRILRLRQLMGLEALYAKPNTSHRHPAHRIYPYLLRNLAIVRPCQVWAIDITYIRLRRGYCYLVAIIDWFSRYILSWRLSPSLETAFCIEALKDALQQDRPDIFNSDQGSQFTSDSFTNLLLESDIRISMDGRGSYHDNIFTERFWRSVKYEDVYLKDYETIDAARTGLATYIDFYNTQRPHQALKYQTPAQVHFKLAATRPVDMMDNANALPTSPQAQQRQQLEMEETV